MSSTDSGGRSALVRRAAKDIKDGMLVNLGIGLPTQVVPHIPPGLRVCFHSENGILGVGHRLSHDHADRNLIDAGGTYVSTIKGTSFFDSSVSFSLVRGGRLDMALLGAFEVSQEGDLANWIIPGSFTPGMGGAIELAQKSQIVSVLMTHVGKNGEPKIVKKCKLPLTAKACIRRIYTDMAVIDVTDDGLVLKELYNKCTLEQVRNLTEADLVVSDDPIPRYY